MGKTIMKDLIYCITFLFTIIFALYNFIKETRHYKKELEEIRQENFILCYGIKACLSGLIQQGVNHDVPKAYHDLEKHLNINAHKRKE